VEIIWALIVVVVAADVVVVAEVVVEIISILVAVGRGGDYLDTSSGSSSRDYFREISCSESVLWTTNCPIVLACNGLGDSGHFLQSLYTFGIQSVFLLFIKYTHDYPHPLSFPPSFLLLSILNAIHTLSSSIHTSKNNNTGLMRTFFCA
jgi:hypothetical protein